MLNLQSGKDRLTVLIHIFGANLIDVATLKLPIITIIGSYVISVKTVNIGPQQYNDTIGRTDTFGTTGQPG
jgi:hypothetical protein